MLTLKTTMGYVFVAVLINGNIHVITVGLVRPGSCVFIIVI